MDPVVIEVNDIPDILPPPQMVEQLKIHFLKRSNNGGDVLMVIYPTSTSGQAYVVFESHHVPGVLEFKHFLEIDGKFYPIHVKNSHLAKVDMQVETTLNLEVFPGPEKVIQLVTSHGFEVTKLKNGLLHLRGSFIKLKLLRGKLMLLQRNAPQIYNGYSSAILNGSSPTQVKPRGLDPTFNSKPSPNHDYIKSNKEITHQSDQSFGSVASPYKDLYPDGKPSLYSGRSSATQTRTSPSYAEVLHQPSSLILHYDFSTTYQRDFSGTVDPKSGLGYDTGNGKGAYLESSDSPSNNHSQYSSTQHRSMPSSASSFGSSGSSAFQRESRFPNPAPSSHSSYSARQHTAVSASASASQMEPRSLKITSRESERRRNYTELSTMNHSTQSPTQHRSGIGSFGSPAPRMAATFSNPTSATQSGSDESLGSRKHSESSTHGNESQPNSGSRRRRPSVDGASSLSFEYPPTQQRSGFPTSPLSSDREYSSSSSTGITTSFPVDTDTLNYILTQDQEKITMIDEVYSTEMSLQDNAEFTTVTFKGRDCESAKRDLLALMTTFSLTLRTQEIDLTQYDQAHQVQILKRIEHLKEPGVLIKRNNGLVKIVGSSRQSFEIKQKLISVDAERQRGRSTEKSSRSHRSSSVPRQHKIHDQQRRSSSPEARTGRNPAQDAQDLQTIPMGTTKDLQRHQSEDLPSSNDEKKSKYCPKILQQLVTNSYFKKKSAAKVNTPHGQKYADGSFNY